jgi:hypothetical protein
MLIDVGISGDRNVITKEIQNILEYKNPYNRNRIHVECKTKYDTCNKATGTISKSFRKYLSNVPGKHEIKELQKTAILGTAHTLRKVLM